jgi:hypothetical protein
MFTEIQSMGRSAQITNPVWFAPATPSVTAPLACAVSVKSVYAVPAASSRPTFQCDGP